MKCAKCTRAYCSRDCQVKDWKIGNHKVWCGKSGEKCVDYEIREADGNKGLGLFTLRDFHRGEKLLVERAVATRPGAGRPINRIQLQDGNVMKAAMALSPAESTDFDYIFETNCAALGDIGSPGTGLFINFSRVNHSCVGNSAHFYDEDIGLKLLVANHAIPKGTEVTFNYVPKKMTFQRTLAIGINWGFRCSCNACQHTAIANKLDRILVLDREIPELSGTHGLYDEAIQVGRALLKLYDELQVSDMEHARTYYDLYQLAILRQRTARQGIDLIQESYKHALRFYGREENSEVQKHRRCAENPRLHRNFLRLRDA